MFKKTPLLTLAAAGALLSSQAVAQAQSATQASPGVISFSFSGNANNPAYVDPTLTAGAFPVKNFNTDNGGNSGGVGSGSLADANGTTVATSLTYNSYDAQTGSLARNGSYTTDGNQQLMNGFIESGPPAAANAAATVTVSSVPYTTYSLYVYFFNGALGSPGGTPSTGTYTVTTGTGGTTRASQNAMLESAFNVSNPYTLATATTSGDYLIFSGLTGPTFTLTANRVTGDTSTQTFIPIDGFQIVATPAAAPEPAAFVPVLLGLGLVGLLAVKRRRQGVPA